MTGKLKESSVSLELGFNFYQQELQDGWDYEVKQHVRGKYHETLDWYNQQLFSDDGDEGSTEPEAYHRMRLQLWEELEETERVSQMLVLLLTNAIIFLISPPLPL